MWTVCLSFVTGRRVGGQPWAWRGHPTDRPRSSRSTSLRAGRSGPIPTITGLDGETPATGTAVITDDLADKLNIEAGDDIAVFAYGEQLALQVDRRSVRRRGVAGYWTVDGRQQSYNVLVAPGTIASLASASWFSRPRLQRRGLVPPEVMVAVSNVGGVESGAELTEAATADINGTIADLT